MKIQLPGQASAIRPGKLLCIGQNYARHAAEMKSRVPDKPMIFLKPSTALVGDGGRVVLPSMSRDVHHEVELVVLIGRTGKHIPESEALAYVGGYAIGLDMTARDLQAEAKAKGHPWSVAKGFDTFAPVGAFVPADAVADPQDVQVRMAVNGEIRQDGHTGDMIFPVARLIAYASRIFTLEAGDLLFTGTPEGVGPVQPGDVLEATGTGLPALRVTVHREA
ncbi:isomerase/hydrolase [Rhodothermaceae bacterium RA]|nr:isomerase/hydrolase [Rhodothermaceae bacterium RA]